MEENATFEKILNRKKFVHEVEEEDKKLVKAISRTQLFHHFVEDAFEYEDNYEINLFNDCIRLQKKMGHYAEDYIRDRLNPKNWELQTVNVDLPKATDLPENWEAESMLRDPDRFPKLEKSFFGKRMPRLSPTKIAQSHTIVPEDLDAVLKKLKKQKKEWAV